MVVMVQVCSPCGIKEVTSGPFHRKGPRIFERLLQNILSKNK